MDWDLLSSYAGLLSLATASIYAGSFGSLPVGDPQIDHISKNSMVNTIHNRNPHESHQESHC